DSATIRVAAAARRSHGNQFRICHRQGGERHTTTNRSPATSPSTYRTTSRRQVRSPVEATVLYHHRRSSRSMNSYALIDDELYSIDGVIL
ncbi:hypothetical protein Dimus_013352, partial [Dionaea muscipula]